MGRNIAFTTNPGLAPFGNPIASANDLASSDWQTRLIQIIQEGLANTQPVPTPIPGRPIPAPTSNLQDSANRFRRQYESVFSNYMRSPGRRYFQAFEGGLEQVARSYFGYRGSRPDRNEQVAILMTLDHFISVLTAFRSFLADNILKK